MPLIGIGYSIAIAFGAGMFTIGGAAAQEPSATEAKAIAADAYLYAYPMLFNYGHCSSRRWIRRFLVT